jgi:hypothetical protein
MHSSRFRFTRHATLRIVFLLLIFASGTANPAQTKHALAAAASNASDRQAEPQPLTIPVGTILPIALNKGFSTKTAQPGQAISGRMAQDVPLPNGGKLKTGAKVSGTILSVYAAGKNGDAKISFRLTSVEFRHGTIPIVATLRALASFMEVQYAQIPDASPGFGTPYRWVTTDQIGGDVKYGVDGPVTDSSGETVGRGTAEGVLVRITKPPGSACRGDLENSDRLQALWVFSSDACGVYGMPGVKILHAGRTEPVGEIVLSSDTGEVNVRAGAGLLLRLIE